MVRKASLGRQKIKIARIEKPNHRQVTFSKRRSGLFKKACELCTLCGVEIAIVVFSPANKVFSFGHPNVESIVDRFVGGAGLGVAAAEIANSNVQHLNMQLTRVNEMMDDEKEKKEALEREKKWWWETPIEKLGKNQLEELASSLEELKKTVALQAKVVNETASLQTKQPTTGFSGFAGNNWIWGLVENYMRDHTRLLK